MVKEGMWLIASVASYCVVSTVIVNLIPSWQTFDYCFAVSNFGEAEKKLLLLIVLEIHMIIRAIFQGMYSTSLHLFRIQQYHSVPNLV